MQKMEKLFAKLLMKQVILLYDLAMKNRGFGARKFKLFPPVFPVCETVYHQKNVTEVQPQCKTIMMPMCMKNEKGVENCVQIPRKVRCISELSRLKCMICF